MGRFQSAGSREPSIPFILAIIRFARSFQSAGSREPDRDKNTKNFDLIGVSIRRLARAWIKDNTIAARAPNDVFNPQARESLIYCIDRVLNEVHVSTAGSREPDQQTFYKFKKHLHITFLLQSTKYHNIFLFYTKPSSNSLLLKSRCELSHRIYVHLGSARPNIFFPFFHIKSRAHPPVFRAARQNAQPYRYNDYLESKKRRLSFSSSISFIRRCF